MGKVMDGISCSYCRNILKQYNGKGLKIKRYFDKNTVNKTNFVVGNERY